MQMTLYVGRLGSHEDGGDLNRLFAGFGGVVYAKVVANPDRIRRGTFGVVQMQTTGAAHDAIRALDNSEYHGRTLSVRAATAAEETAAGHPRMFESMNFIDDSKEGQS